MTRQLIMMEVSQKQAYIFSSNKLSDNILNSDIIRYVMSPEYFSKKCSNDVFTEENIVYSGGGHVVLEYRQRKDAEQFVRKITSSIMKEFRDVEVFAKIIDFEPEELPSVVLKRLVMELEKKKALRASAFKQGTFGFEMLNPDTFRPELEEKSISQKSNDIHEVIEAERYIRQKYQLVTEFSKLGISKDKKSFISIVHIDGNQMGNRVSEFRNKIQDSVMSSDIWEVFKQKSKEFSNAIDADFKLAYKNMVIRVDDAIQRGKLNQLELGNNGALQNTSFPIRKVISAGDDICFVCEGRIGIECASIYLEELAKLTNRVDGRKYSACAGVAIVHQKYPFYRAYELAEQLCSNAKKFASSYVRDDDAEVGVSAMDWHIEYGEVKDTVEEIRRSYLTLDHCHLEMRPYIVVDNAVSCQEELYRRYKSFKKIMVGIQSEKIAFARGKLKQLREVMKKGVNATEIYVTNNLLSELKLIYSEIFTEFNKDKLFSGEELEKRLFLKTKDNMERSILFDAIELMDTYIMITGEEVE